MIPNKLQFHTFSFVMSFLMSGLMSLTMLAFETPILLEIFLNWPKAWAISMLVAFPASLFVVPMTQRFVSKIVVQKHNEVR
ncbi:DUF2798 domain-containing protein [Paraglaciecola sp.]|uniref:DUF2798 domain-containing protein n=1 Tax=Paraglaciecola sp. TaxID=1920173 RepID=UPI003265ACA0